MRSLTPALAAVLSALVVGSITVAAPRIDVPGLRTVQDEGTAVTFRPTINFAGAGVSCVDDTTRTTCTIAGGLTTAYQTVADEGSSLTQRTTVNFIGGGVSCVDNAGSSRTDCTITGAATSAYDTVQDEGVSLTQRTTIDFTGTGITCTDTGAKTQCTVSGGGAPTNATYITQTSDATLTNEQALSSLSTGLMKVTTGTGVVSTAVSGTDYAPATSGSTVLLGNGLGGFSSYAGTSCTNQFPRSLSTAGAATCASVALGTDVSGTLGGSNGGLGAAQPTCTAGDFLTCNGTSCSCATPSGGGGGLTFAQTQRLVFLGQN